MMIKKVLFLFALALSSCSGNVDNQQTNIERVEEIPVKSFEYKGHEYLYSEIHTVAEGRIITCLIHSESCKCKKP